MLLLIKNKLQKFYYIAITIFLLRNSVTLANALKCQLNSPTPVISLSAPISLILDELNLLEDQKLMGLSKHHFSSARKFSDNITILGGGLFISPKILKRFGPSLIFYDESRDLKVTLQRLNNNNVEIQTLHKDPFEVFDLSLNVLKPYLINCETLIDSLTKKVEGIKKKLISTKNFDQAFIFYLGEIAQGDRPPNLIVVQDGPVLFWLKNNKMITYPSKLSYVSWSPKIMDEFLIKNPNALKVGLVGSDYVDKKIVNQIFFKQTNNYLNIYHDQLLLPGLGQIYFMEKFNQYLDDQASNKPIDNHVSV